MSWKSVQWELHLIYADRLDGWTDGQTDRHDKTKLIGAFRDYANGPNKYTKI